MKPLPLDYITKFEPVDSSRSTEVTARAMGSRKLVLFILNSLVPTFRPMWKANCLAHHFTNTDKFLISGSVLSAFITEDDDKRSKCSHCTASNLKLVSSFNEIWQLLVL